MQSFYDLYNELVQAAMKGELQKEVEAGIPDLDEHQLDCLLNPQKYAPVWRMDDCTCSDEEKKACEGRCLFDAFHRDEQGNMVIDPDRCVGCSICIDQCKAKKLMESKEVLPLVEVLKEGKKPVYAMIAPAFIGQFSSEVTPGKLRTAFKRLGFAGMVEVALFADILTLKEALEFDRTIQKEEDFLLTSCCCPIWIAMIRRVYDQLVTHVPGSVSPMVACGRSIKLLDPDAVTVFIGPCVAKKAEAKEKDIADAVDYVLTFQEVRDLFDFARIDLRVLEPDERDHSSRAGRIYARSGGVSEAVKNTLNKISPNRKIPLTTSQANGVPECKAMLNRLMEGKADGNFLEGMGCIGGCVGGPKAILNRDEGRRHVNEYGDTAAYETPAENPYVMELLHRLGLPTVESLLEHSDIFTRDLGAKVK